MFGQIEPTQFDLRFSLFRVPVRVHPIFWLTSAVLAWPGSDGDLRFVIIRILCVFLAVLVHEMGHAIVTRLFGWDPEIVLYFFGGYATSARHTTWKDIAVSAAGPAAGFLLFGGILAFEIAVIAQQMILNGPEQHDLLLDAVAFSLFINFVWNVVNLLPVLPLDGGQISRELFCWFSPRRGMEYSLMLSMIASGGVALWAVQCTINGRPLLGLEPRFLALMFGYLAYQSYRGFESARRGYW